MKVALRGRGDDESRHGQGAGGKWGMWKKNNYIHVLSIIIVAGTSQI